MTQSGDNRAEHGDDGEWMAYWGRWSALAGGLSAVVGEALLMRSPIAGAIDALGRVIELALSGFAGALMAGALGALVGALLFTITAPHHKPVRKIIVRGE